MLGKRANGEGSIHQRKDGRWCASLSIGRGKRKHFLARTRAEVARRLAGATDAREKGAVIPTTRQNVRQFFTSWLDATKPTVRPRTFVRYEELVRLHVLPATGSMPLTRLTPQHLHRLYQEKLESGLSPTTVNHIHAVVHKALSLAVRWSLTTRNVADFVDPPRTRHFEINTLSPDQAQTFLAAIAGTRLEALYVLALTTGMRQGELLGLRWRDVDLEHATVQVRGTMQPTPAGLRIAEPKTHGSRRHVLLAARAVDALRRHRVAQAEERLRLGAAWEDNELVFANQVGRPIAAQNLLRRSFEPLLKRAGLPRMRFHDLRHSAATLLLGEGIHPKIVSEMLGHTRISTTLDLYSHVTPTMQRQAADAFDAILKGS
ncbi:MAG: tyrosine-type recombinase/integrase [Dehalococcoidia bacterium]